MLNDYNIDIDVNSLIRQYTSKVEKNDPPYTKIVKDLNNILLNKIKTDCWNETQQIKVNDAIRKMDVFIDGSESLHIKELCKLSYLSDEEIDFIIKFLSQDIEILYKFGFNILNILLLRLSIELDSRKIKEKIKLIYTDDNFKQWDKRFKNRSIIIEEGILIPGLNPKMMNDFMDKIGTIFKYKLSSAKQNNK